MRFRILPNLRTGTCESLLSWLLRNSHVRHKSGATDSPWGGGNLILMGCPGCGKTTVGGILSRRLGVTQTDVDNDHLEPLWGTTVGEKLDELGDDAFLEEEGRALLRLNVSGRIISMTGSNPLHKAAMTKLRATGTVVYIDVPIPSILSRLHQMKTDRIVGLQAGQTIEDVLRYRLQFYEALYDIRVLVGKADSCERIADMVQERLLGNKTRTGYVSTRANSSEAQDEITKDFAQTTREGFAQDGGLYVPYYKLPNSTLSEWERLVEMNYQDRGLRILQRWISCREMNATTMRSMLERAYNDNTFGSDQICPVRHLSDNQYVVELFRGPTASFKDLALQLMPQFFERSVQSNKGSGKERHLILVATSGDTGGAVLDGFSRHTDDRGISVMVLYPEVGVSAIQKAQMTSMNGPRTRVIGVNGDFDFCQSTIKQIFRDPDVAQDLKKSHNCYLSAANSISWARLLPQVVYHCSAYLDLVRQGAVTLGQPVDYCIPTGNFGNILAAFYAKTMGIPFGRLTAACNVNNVVSDFVATGRYDLTSRTLKLTASPAIDILKSSNLERYLWQAAGRDGGAIKALYSSLDDTGFFQVSNEIKLKVQHDFSGGWCSEDDCMATIKSTFHKTGYILDPHTAVAKVVADRASRTDRPTLIAATAHCGKFADVVLSALGHDVHEQSPASMLRTLCDLSPSPGKHERLSASLQSTAKEEPLCEATPADVINRIKQFLSSF